MPRFQLVLLVLTVALAALAGQILWGDAVIWGAHDDGIIWGALDDQIVWGD